MTQTIEQLTARIAELEEENARLKAECDDIKQVQFPRKLEAVSVGWKKQLAVSQLHAEQLRREISNKDVLVSNWWANLPDTFCSAWNDIESPASQPRDTSALDAYVSDKVKEAVSTQKGYYESVFQDGAKRISILTRQRDLAVEWLERCAVHVRPTATIFYEEIMEALSTIKESEGK